MPSPSACASRSTPAAPRLASSDCTLGTSETGTGFRNAATLTVNGESAPAIACAPFPILTITKSVVGAPTANGDGTWTIGYDLTVANTGAACGPIRPGGHASLRHGRDRADGGHHDLVARRWDTQPCVEWLQPDVRGQRHHPGRLQQPCLPRDGQRRPSTRPPPRPPRPTAPLAAARRAPASATRPASPGTTAGTPAPARSRPSVDPSTDRRPTPTPAPRSRSCRSPRPSPARRSRTVTARPPSATTSRSPTRVPARPSTACPTASGSAPA